MKRTVWVLIACGALSCSGGSQGNGPGNSGTTPAPQDDSPPAIVQDAGAGVTATSCKMKYPIKSWEDRTSKYAFCERLGLHVNVCEIRFGESSEYGGMCEYMNALDDLRVEIAEECMTQEFDVAMVPEMIAALETCSWGEEYHATKWRESRHCDVKVACYRSVGFRWVPARPK